MPFLKPGSSCASCIWCATRSSTYPGKDRKELVADLKPIYHSASEEQAMMSLNSFAAKWDKKYPAISKSWRSHWAQVIPMFAFPAEIPESHVHNKRNRISEHDTPKSKSKSSDLSGLTTQSLRLCIWPYRTYRKNGPCRSETGGRR